MFPSQGLDAPISGVVARLLLIQKAILRALLNGGTFPRPHFPPMRLDCPEAHCRYH